MKTNHIPKGLVPLEILFENNDVYLKPTNQSSNDNTINCNIGTEKEPKMVKILRVLSKAQRKKYVELLKEYSDVFAWTYQDLKTYDPIVIQHKIPLKPNTKLFKQKLRHLNPVLLPIIEQEIKKLCDAKIIVHLRFSNWVPNLIPVRMKSGEIRLCVDFINLNKCFIKDNYPLPKMDYILQKVVGSSRISMIYGFSRYNQVFVHEYDKEKTKFVTPWGTFM